MTSKHWLLSAVAGATLSVFAVSAQAAPMGALTDNATAAKEAAGSPVDQVRCRGYWRNGYFHCYRRNYYDYSYAPYYYGPGVGLYFGGGGHRHYGHRRHR
jgi:hypothetical protein